MSDIRIISVEGRGLGTQIRFIVDGESKEAFLNRSLRMIDRMTAYELTDLLVDRERAKSLRKISKLEWWWLGVKFRRENRKSPPALAELLFSWLAPKKTLHEQLGDLQEIFETNCERFGKRRARRLYWTQVLRAVGPGIWRKVKNLGFIGILIDYSRSKIGW
jgi:hypothetical protein